MPLTAAVVGCTAEVRPIVLPKRRFLPASSRASWQSDRCLRTVGGTLSLWRLGGVHGVEHQAGQVDLGEL
ncbi:hypothetical protein, partial [Curtobacterium poinsettiae]|uniref:hypothetical protein n=1 Tax=Curtobacterium poinsettiae TaxID=159612 RepID=UPI001BDE2089